MTTTEQYLAKSGGRLACPHPVHRFATVPNPKAQVVIPECAGQAAWLKGRQGGIGGSEIGALIGASEYETAWSVWSNKLSDGKDLSGVAAVEWGHRFEDAVAGKVAEEIGMVDRFAGGLWADPAKPWLRVTPDRFATGRKSWIARALIECKTAGDGDHWVSGSITAGGQGDGRAPLSYQAQAQWQMGIIGLKTCYLGCYVSNRARDFYVVEVEFNPGWFDEMANAATKLWTEHVQTGEPPIHDYRHPKTEEMLKQQFPTVVKPSVILPEDVRALLLEYKAAKAAAEESAKELDSIKNFIRFHVGDAAAGYLGEKKVVSNPEVNSSSFNVEAFREDYPELAKKYTRKGSYRRMTITVPKDLT